MTISKTKQFFEASFKNGKLSAELVPMRFTMFPSHLSKVRCLSRESEARSYSAAPVTQNHLSKPEDPMLQKQPLSGTQHLDLLISLTPVSLVLRLPREIHLRRSASNVPLLPTLLKLRRNRHVLLTLDKVQNPLRLPCETTPERPKVVQTCGAFNILT